MLFDLFGGTEVSASGKIPLKGPQLRTLREPSQAMFMGLKFQPLFK